MSKQPLLDSATNGAADVAAQLEAGLGDGDGGLDFQDLLEQHPDAVMEYIVKHGTKLLGTFKCKDVEVLPLIRDSALWTMGSDNADGDWQAAWRRRIDQQPGHSKGSGFGTTVEVEAHVVTIKNAGLPDDEGLLNPLLEKYKEGSLTSKIFGVPAVQAVIQFKWDKWAKQYLLYEFYIFLVWLLSFQLFVWLFQDEKLKLSLGELIHTTRGAFTISAAALSLAAMAVFVYIEICTLVEYGFTAWFSVWNSLDLLTYGLQIAIAIMYFGRLRLDSLTLSILLASQILLLFWKIQYFSRAFQPLKNSFVETLRAVVLSVRWFLVLLLLTLWGFAASFYILFRSEQGKQFQDMWHSFLTCFSFMVSGFEMDFFYKSSHPVVGSILLVVFIFSMSMVLLNALIAIMSDAATAAADTDGTKFLAAKADIIDELEQSIPQWHRGKDWYPKYIHILKVNPKSASATIDNSALWALTEAKDDEGDEDPNEDVMKELADVKAQLDEIKQLLKASAPNSTAETSTS